MSIRLRILAASLGLISLFAGVSAFTFWGAKRANERLVLLNSLHLPLMRDLIQIQINVHSLAEEIRRYSFEAKGNAEQSTFVRMARDLYPYIIEKKFNHAESLLLSSEAGIPKGMAEDFTRSLSEARGKFGLLLSLQSRAEFEQKYKDFRTKLQEISQRVDLDGEAITLAAQRESTQHLWISFGLSLLVVLCGVFTFFFSRKLLQPLPALIGSLKKIADGDFDQSLKFKTSSQDEFSLLAREYNRMLVALVERDKQIKKQQGELLQSERLAAVGQLSAEVVHEIRNPLNSISLNIDWLQEEIKSPTPEVEKTLLSMSREVERLHQITESYLVRSKIPSSETEPTEINELIKEILDFTREEDRVNAIEVEALLAQEKIYVRSDRSKLKQALLNVVKNAREAMPRGGKLRVTTALKENVSRIEISDTGFGMNDNTQTKAFHPFFTTKSRGTGLGLTLTRNIVEEAHGTLSCESRVGTGTTFTFRFPL